MTLDPQRPWNFFVEDEISAAGEAGPVATVFLTNRQCPWRCVMCDLWKNTLAETVAPGAIPAQIDYALSRLPAARDVKLYNSGSFFDPHAIPVCDYDAIAERVHAFRRVVVECHPALVGDRCLPFRDKIGGTLEVAMGLETAHPEILPRLNKQMTLGQFSAAALFLRQNEIDLRVFILVQPPFMAASDSVQWAGRSIDFAFDCGATAATLIPTRGNGDVTTQLPALEESLRYGISLGRGRVFADLWDVKDPVYLNRLGAMNLTQTCL